MKLKYLGTAAAEGYPALFCECERCERARKLGGKNIRGRTQAIIDDKLVIDWPADAFYNSIRFGIDFTFIKSVLISHRHSDHFQPEEFGCRRKGFAYLKSAEMLTVYGSKDIKGLKESVNTDGIYGTSVEIIKPFETRKIEEYSVTPLPAVHGTEQPYAYIIERDGKAILWAHDTDVFEDETFEYIKTMGIVFSLVSLDCTEGENEMSYKGHMNFRKNAEMKEKLLSLGAADDKTIFVINHFSHNGVNTLYEDAEKKANEMGMTSSFDGMEVEF